MFKIVRQRVDLQDVAGLDFFVVWEKSCTRRLGIFASREDAELFVRAKERKALFDDVRNGRVPDKQAATSLAFGEVKPDVIVEK